MLSAAVALVSASLQAASGAAEQQVAVEAEAQALVQTVGWSYYRNDLSGSGYSAAQQITPDNVAGLKPVWSFSTGVLEKLGEGIANTAFEATPILLPAEAGGHLAICTPFNDIIALDPETGEQRWRFDANTDRRGSRPGKCRGVSYWQRSESIDSEVAPADQGLGSCAQRIITATHDRRLLAIDANSGELCKHFGDGGVVKLYRDSEGFVPGDLSSSSPPLIAGNTIVVGSGVVDFKRAKTPLGTVLAFDAETGEERWRFQTVAHENSAPEVKASWPKNASEVSGSANAWAPLSADLENDLVFVPTGAPSPDFYGGLRPGDNLNANSVIALRVSTGEVVWRYQFVHHDLWDYDTPAMPLLTDIERDGEAIPALIQVTKQGFVFVLNRLTGVPIYRVNEVPVPQTVVAGEQPSPTQPVPEVMPRLMDTKIDQTDAWGLTPWDKGHCEREINSLYNEGLFTPLQLDQFTVLMPGSLGGANWGGAVLWKDKNLMVVNVNTAIFAARLVRNPDYQTPDEQRSQVALAENKKKPTEHVPKSGQTMRINMSGTPYTIENKALMSPLGIPCIKPPWGKLMAIDIQTGEVRWQSPLGSVHEMGPVKVPFHINWGTPNLGGAIVTAGGVVFIGATMDRQFRAFDALSGEQLWTHDLPVDGVASPMTYVLNGKQYVVISAGGHHMFGRPMGDSIVAFALDD
ncbi:MAG: pyrroloquinoline quinone-dependent dehydrogenase [Cellvibrionaceae bacterium]